MKIIKKAYYNPLVVFLLTIGYGLLKIDFGDTEGRVPYGWFYVLIVMWIFASLYLVAYIRVFWYVSRKVKNKQGPSEYLVSPLIIFLIINISSLFSSPFEIMFGLYGITTYSGVAFAISLVGLAITGHLLDGEKDIYYFSSKNKINRLLPTIIAIGIVGIPILTWWTFDAIKEAGQKQDYQQILEKGYQTKGKDYQIKMLRQYALGKEGVRVEYTLKDGDYEIPAGAELRKNKQDSFDIQQSTYVTLEQDYTKLATIQVNSEAGQNVLKDYVNEVEASLKKIKVNDKFLVKNETESSSIYNQPHFSVIYLNWEQEAPNELKESLTKAKKSNQIGQCEFDGWVSLKVPDLMKIGLLIPEISVDYDWDLNSETDDLDWDEVDSLRRKVEEKLLAAIDYTKLLDGNYILSGSEDQLLKVKNGKLSEIGEIPSRVAVGKSNESNFSSSGDYTEWE